MANLLTSKEAYSRYYGDFRGVDFSSDHTQVSEQRLAYSVNMYKDYQSGQGKALETIPGFRRRIELPDKIHGIHYYRYKDDDGKEQEQVLIHSGTNLYLWRNYPKTAGVTLNTSAIIPEPTEVVSSVPVYVIPLADIHSVVEVHTSNGESINFSFKDGHLIISNSTISPGDTLYILYKEGELTDADILFSDMNAHKSESFVFNNRLYFIDGKNYLVYDGKSIKSALEDTYVPTTYKNIVPAGENADIGLAYEERNILQPKFKHTFYGDGTTKVFYMNEKNLNGIIEVKVYGDVLKPKTDYTADLAAGKVEFLKEAPDSPLDAGYPETYAGIEITASKAFTEDPISKCTICATFDDRVFLSGNPDHPNHIYFCGRSNVTGYTDPTYFPATNYVVDGVGMAPITGLLPVADALMALKSDTQQDGSVYFHTPLSTEKDVHPKDYPSTRGLAGTGCLGSCTNFLDDPVFVSRLGVEAVGQLSVRLERAIEHRSSLIDAKLANLNLENAVLAEWNGYLIVLVDGRIFMADSRQRYTDETGVMQYEWYYLEDIGIFKDQYLEYRYSPYLYPELEGVTVSYSYCKKCGKSTIKCTCEERKATDTETIKDIPLYAAEAVYYNDTLETKDLRGMVANPPNAEGNPDVEIFNGVVTLSTEDENGKPIEYDVGVYYTVHKVYDKLTDEFVRYEAYLCEGKGNYTGGKFDKACVVKNLDNNLFFATESGIICSFNFDMRNEQGEIPTKYYSFDERTIHCGCATKMDSCGIPHMTKSTVKKSTVIKTKTLKKSAAKIKVRTNKKPYNQIARIDSNMFSFEDMDFADFSFTTSDQNLFAVKEKEKQWVEKQYYLYSDEYLKPFALYYISYRYTIAGRYKG